MSDSGISGKMSDSGTSGTNQVTPTNYDKRFGLF